MAKFLRNRSRGDSLPDQDFKRNALIFTLIAFAVVYVLWNTPQLAPILYPFRLFVTYVHEAGHALMAILTGGRVIGFSVSADGSGLAVTAGGIRALILPAGYLGAALFGAGLFYLVNTVRYTRLISITLGIGLIVFSVLFARADSSGVPLALLVGLGFGVVLILIGWYVGQGINILLLSILAIITSLNAVLDIFYIINTPQATGRGQAGAIHNDAAAFSAEVFPLIPPVVWAILWALIAIGLLWLAVYYSILRPLWSSKSSK